MKYGRICAGSEELNCNFDALARTPGFFSVSMVLREGFLITRSRMAVFLGNRPRQRRRGAFTPSSPAEGTRPTQWTELGLPDGLRRR